MSKMVSPEKKERAKAAGERHPGPGAAKLDKRKKRQLNLKEEASHAIGEERLAVEEAARDPGP